MIKGGNVTIFVEDLGKAVNFYTKVLGLKLIKRHSKHWATLGAGGGLIIGLHEKSSNHPQPGTKGAVLIGLQVVGSLRTEVERLENLKVHVERTGVDEIGKFAYIHDPDGNPLYLFSTRR